MVDVGLKIAGRSELFQGALGSEQIPQNTDISLAINFFFGLNPRNNSNNLRCISHKSFNVSICKAARILSRTMATHWIYEALPKAFGHSCRNP